MVRTRFAPSPTGYLHIGGARTALFNYLYAKKMKGTFILRVEDTDTQRSTEESVNAILDSMKWLGLDWDEGPFYQTERMDRYKYFAEKLLADGNAYYCYCTPEELQERREQAMREGRKPTYDRRCREIKALATDRKPVIRFKSPLEGETVVEDVIKGRVVFKNEELDDLVIVRSDGVPTYNFAVVVDDAEMNITHIIRGDDHLNNTPRQMQIYNALDFSLPVFGHVPMILGSDKTRLSKRHGATSVMAYKDMGYLSEALVNYLVRLGWSCGDQEIFSMDEMIEKFAVESIGKSAAVFNPEKLLWLNAHYIKNHTPEKLADLAWEYFAEKGYTRPSPEMLDIMMASLQPRCRTLLELADMGDVFFESELTYDEQAVKKFFPDNNTAVLKEMTETIRGEDSINENFFEGMIRGIAEARGIKVVAVAQQLRIALSGKTVSPGLLDVIKVIGKDASVKRIERAIEFISKKS
jgi:glutamyl-tRNA synthetase